jgi:hybrid cluster-associated redox disulfide protein
MEITRESIIGDILDFDPTTAIYFLEIGMHCLGCPMSRGESIADACSAHGQNAEELLAKLNNALTK